MRVFFGTLIYSILTCSAWAQCPHSEFVLDNQYCTDEQFVIENLSAHYDSLSWDFCVGDLKQTPGSETLGVSLGTGTTWGLEIVEENGAFFGFVPSRGNGKLIRLNFGNSIANQPTVSDLGNLGLSDVRSIAIQKVGPNFIGLCTSLSGNSIYLLHFGGNIMSIPSISNITNGTPLNAPISTKLVEWEGTYFGFIVNFSGSTITRLNFGSFVDSDFTSDAISFSTPVSNLSDIQFIKQCSGVSALITSRGNGKLIRKDFGTDLSSTPVETVLSNTLISPTALTLGKDIDIELYVSSFQSSGTLQKVTLNENLDIISSQAFGNLNGQANETGLVLKKTNSEWNMIYLTNGGNIGRYTFDNICPDSDYISHQENPAFSFGSDGEYIVQLTTITASGLEDRQTDTINIIASVAPDIDFTISEDRCSENTNLFSSLNNSGDISTYQWIIDSDTLDPSSMPDTTYQLATGRHEVSLLVESIAGCTNQVTKSLEIYDPPAAAGFEVTGTLCSGTELSFNNTTPEMGLEEVIAYHWDFNGEGTSDKRHAQFQFDSGGEKYIELVASIPGCADTTRQLLDLEVGPNVDFQWTNNCFGDSVQFDNLTVKEGITAYEWQFGDGYLSDGANPKHYYEEAGSYTVSLTVTNENNCNTTLEKTLVVNDQPLVDFDFEQPVENLPFQLTGDDLTVGEDSVLSWIWSIPGMDDKEGDNISLRLVKGFYEVVLLIETVQGCADSVVKDIEVLDASCPTVQFEIPDSGCLDEPLILENKSINTTEIVWDLCPGDLEKVPAYENFQKSLGVNNSWGFEMVRESGSFYGFVPSRTDGRLVRYQFGEQLDAQSSEAVDLGNLGLQGVYGISMLKTSEGWKGLCVSLDNRLLLLDFGASLLNTPTVQDISAGITMNQPLSVKLVKDGNEYFAFIANFSASYVNRIQFGLHLNSEYVSDQIGFVNQVGQVSDIEVIESCSSFSVFITSRSNGRIMKLHFSDSLSGSPEESILVGGLSSPTAIVSGHDFSDYLFFSSFGGGIHRIKLNENLNYESMSSLGNLALNSPETKLKLAKKLSNWSMVSLTNNGALGLYEFPEDCDLSSPIRTNADTVHASFISPGMKVVEMMGVDENGHVAYYYDSLDINSNQAPTLTLTSDPSLCISNPTAWTSEITSGTVSSYSWDLDGDGIEDSSEPNPTFQYPSPGTYNVRLDVQSDEGCNNYFEDQITLYPEPPVPEFSINGDACTDQELILANSTNESAHDDLVTYEWYLDGELLSYAQDTAYIFPEPGSHIFGLKSLIPGCESEVITKEIDIAQTASADFQQDTICLGQSMFFTNLSEHATAYQWDFGDGNASEAFEPEHIYADTGVYFVQLTALDEGGACETTLTKSVRVNRVPPQPQFDVVAEAYCILNDIELVNQTNDFSYFDDVIYTWVITGFDTIRAKEPQINFETSGEKVISLYSSYRTCQSEVFSDTIFINDLPQMAFSSTEVCDGDLMTFTNESEGESFLWDFGDGVQSTENSPDHLFPAPGNYDVSLQATDANSCINSITQTVVVSSLPVADFSYPQICVNEEVSFQDMSFVEQSNIASWEWYANDQLVSTERNPDMIFSSAGSQTVRLVVYSTNGCEAFLQQNVLVTDVPEVKVEAGVGCLGESTVFRDASGSQGNVASRIWVVDGVVKSGSAQTISQVFNTPGVHTAVLISNQQSGCAGVDSLSVTIPSNPSLEIDLINHCENEEMIASDTTEQISGNEVISRVWNLNGSSIGNGSSVIIPATEGGTYLLSLDVTTAFGCQLNYSQSVIVDHAPEVDFSPSSDFGVPPFSIAMTNNTLHAETYTWYLNDNLVSTERQPKLNVSSEGQVAVKLVAEGASGCVDSAAIMITSALPRVDLAIKRMQLTESGGVNSILLDVLNKSNIPVEVLNFNIELEGGFSVNERVKQRINIGQQVVIQLNTGIPEGAGAVGYFCVTVESPYEVGDESPRDNEFCTNLESNESVMEPPFPNPARNNTVVRAVLPESGPVIVRVIDMAGEEIIKHVIPNAVKGLNTFDIDLLKMEVGTYLITIEYGQDKRRFRIIKH